MESTKSRTTNPFPRPTHNDNFLYRVENEEFVAHGKRVVLYMMKNEGLITFEKMWRQHFLDSMTPKHLPELWLVKKTVKSRKQNLVVF